MEDNNWKLNAPVSSSEDKPRWDVDGYDQIVRLPEFPRDKIVQPDRILKRNKLLLDVMSRNFQSKQDQLDYALHKFLDLSGSQYGYIYFYDEEKETFTLNSWTQGVMKECGIQNPSVTHKLFETGIWGEVIRQRAPIIENHFQRANSLKKGYPKGHVDLKKFMSIPVIMDDKIVAVVGLANKEEDYDDADAYEIIVLMSSVWTAVQRRDYIEKLDYEKNKYFQTLLSIGDGVMVIDQDRNIEFLNPAASDLTGWATKEALGRNYKEVLVLSHEDESLDIEDSVEKAFLTGKDQKIGDDVILISKNGRKYYVEEKAAPIPGAKGSPVGVVLTFRDVTEKKEHIKEIEYMSFHDPLTGLYNRRFFEAELKRLDTSRNLPISILSGDANSLKLTNDIFGHTFGDLLLKKAAEAMKDICRADDIIARWGGDEFMILLPKTDSEMAENIVQRIKSNISKQRVGAIQCSISMGYDTKTQTSEDIIKTLRQAEINMYFTKTLERSGVMKGEFDNILEALYSGSGEEKRHSLSVSRLCGRLGKKLGLSNSDVTRLKKAGRLHDVGKVVLKPELLKAAYPLGPEDQAEMEQHSTVGYRILNYFDETRQFADVVLAHHENWDGSGYPEGIKGENIPLFARIISVVETYDRILHCRDKNKGGSNEKAIYVLKREAGIKFDPRITQAFIEMLDMGSPLGIENFQDVSLDRGINM
ncbi:MAG: diguanylate cyclase [Clostridiales bacterium]|nr:diguanylate cyclase [Clostridiales bacterium]